MEKRIQAPDVFSDFKDRNTVLFRLCKCSPYQHSASLGCFKQTTEILRIPGMHLIHGMNRHLYRLNLPAGMFAQESTASAQYKMIVQIGLRASANCLNISKL